MIKAIKYNSLSDLQSNTNGTEAALPDNFAQKASYIGFDSYVYEAKFYSLDNLLLVQGLEPIMLQVAANTQNTITKVTDLNNALNLLVTESNRQLKRITGENSFKIINDTALYTLNIITIQVVESAIIAELWEGTTNVTAAKGLTGIALPPTMPPITGNFSKIKLTSGNVICYVV